MAKLVIFQDENAEESIFEDFELIAQRLLIGSGLDNDLVLDAPQIDATHASLELRNEYWVLQDLGGPGGTVVNGAEIEGPFHLHYGDLIELGGVKLKFEESEVASEAESVASPKTAPAGPAPLRGRVWFAVAAGYTLAVIFIVIFLLVVADFLGVIRVADLLPFWSG
jgi:pSer/pThr/pTyr-binding forkhead associated (FHA) protein